MPIQNIAILSVHASPLAQMGGQKTGGMNIYVRKLAQELGSRGIAVDIYTRRTTDEQPYIDHSLGKNIQVIHVTAGGLQPLGPDDLFNHLPEFVAGVIAHTTRHTTTYDIIYSHYWLSGWVAQQLKLVWGIPFVQMFHTLGHMKQRIVASAPDTTPSRRMHIEGQIVGWADSIIAATPAEQAQLLWLYRASRRKITIVSPGVDLEQFQPIPVAEAKQQLAMPPEKNMLLFVGRIEPLKAVDTVIHALNILRHSAPQTLQNLEFVIVGGNPDDETDLEMLRLKSLVEELDLEEHIKFIGAKEQSDLLPYYAAAMAVIMPSDYESFGMVALEAMASGTPVIASEVGGLAFLIDDGETGYHVPVREPDALANRIVALLENPEQLQQMRTNALLAANDYRWSTIASKLLHVFEQVHDNPKVSHRRR